MKLRRPRRIQLGVAIVALFSTAHPHLRTHRRDRIRKGPPFGGPYLRAQISARAPLTTNVSTPRSSPTCLKIRFRRLLSAV